MVTINRMLNVMNEAPGNRLEPNKQEPFRLYAQAQEATDDEWGVTNPYDSEDPAKKQSKTPKTKGCGPNPKKSSAEIMSYDDAKLKAYKATLKRFQECVIKECKAKCGPKPAKPPASHLANRKLRDEYVKASKEHALCVQKCEKEGAKELDFNPFDEKGEGAPKPQKEDPEFKRGNPYLREKKEIKLCDCPPAVKDIAVDILAKMKPERRKKVIKNILQNIRSQAVCVEKCKQEGKQIRSDQLPREAAPEPKKERTFERPKFGTEPKKPAVNPLE